MPDLLISADSHITEPADLWTTRLPKHLRDRGLYIDYHDDYHDTVVPGQHFMTSRRFKDADGNYVDGDVEQRLKNLEDDGIWGEVMYPNHAMIMFFPDHELAIAHCRVYNDWIVETFSQHFDRHMPIAMIPLTDVDDAVAEVERVAAKGIRGVSVPTMPPERYCTKNFDRVWAACQALGLVATFHVGTGFVPAKDGEEPKPFFAAELEAMLSGADPHAARLRVEAVFGSQAQPVIQDLVGGGVLDRFPDLHFIATEFNAYWLAGLMGGMDKAYKLGIGQWDEWEVGLFDRARPADDQPAMMRPFAMNDTWPYPLRPSEYVRRQIHCTFMDDPVALQCRHVTGYESLLWGNDYPHAEGTWPKSREAIDTLFAGVTGTERAAILGGTLAKLLNFKVPAVV